MHDGVDEPGTVKRFEEREAKRFKRGGFGATEEFAAWAKEPVDRLAKYIPEQLHRQTQLNLLLQELDPHELALAAIASLTHSALVGCEDPEMTLDIGRAVQGIAFETKVLRPENYSRKVGLAAMEAGYRSTEWAVGEVTQAGNLLLDFCLRALPDWFELRSETALAAALSAAMDKDRPREKRAKAVKVTDDKEDLAVRLREHVMWAHPVLIPCISTKPWTGFRDGGYQEERTRPSVAFVTGAAALHRETRQAIEAAFRDGSIKPHADAVSTLQDVPLRINARVLDTVREYFPDLLEKKFRKKERALKDKQEKMAAAGSTDKAMYWITGQIKQCQRQFKQDKKTLQEELALAEYFKGGPFKLPLHCDFRGRVLPVPHFPFSARRSHPLAVPF